MEKVVNVDMDTIHKRIFYLIQFLGGELIHLTTREFLDAYYNLHKNQSGSLGDGQIQESTASSSTG